nr:hypothetical protein [Tanacetum cinerariifolium]
MLRRNADSDKSSLERLYSVKKGCDDSFLRWKSINTTFKEDLDNLFGPMYEEYFKKKSREVPINSATQQFHNNEELPSISLIIVEEHEAPSIVTTSEE